LGSAKVWPPEFTSILPLMIRHCIAHRDQIHHVYRYFGHNCTSAQLTCKRSTYQSFRGVGGGQGHLDATEGLDNTCIVGRNHPPGLGIVASERIKAKCLPFRVASPSIPALFSPTFHRVNSLPHTWRPICMHSQGRSASKAPSNKSLLQNKLVRPPR